MKSFTGAQLQTLLRGLLGLLMLWAAVSKLGNPTEFLGQIYAYELPLPRTWLQLIAIVLPWVELICGLLLLASIWTETALSVVAAMMVVFVIATGQAWLRGLEISCGCFNLKIFGFEERFPMAVEYLESVGFAFARNLSLTALTVFLLYKRLGELKVVPAAAPLEAQPQPAAAPLPVKHGKRHKPARA